MTAPETFLAEAPVAQRRRQGALAGHLGDEDAARAAFVDPHPAVRAVGLGALVRMGVVTQGDLEAAVADESILVRRRVGELAHEIAQLRLSTAQDYDGRAPAQDYDGRGPAQDYDGRGPDQDHDGGRLGRQKLVAALAGMLDDEDPSLVEAASFGIGEAGLGEAGLGEPGIGVAGLGEAGLGEPGFPASSTDTKALAKLCEIARHHPDTLCRESAVAAIGSVESPEGLETLLEAMRDKPSVRRRAVIALASFESSLAREAIENALSDRDWQVRQAAEDLSGTTKSDPVRS